MAAFCGCCGTEIIDTAEACPVCGMPRHGMVPLGLPLSLAEDAACCPETGAATPARNEQK